MMKVDWDIATVADDLGFPEGPVVLGDGRIALCDIHGGVIRLVAGGRSEVLADVGGGPNGLAIAPDGCLYIANNGGSMLWHREGEQLFSDGFRSECFDSRIERLDLRTGAVTRILDSVDGRPFQAIDDLVFDGRAGFWFTDLGRGGERSRTYGGIYWASMDGSEVAEAAYPLPMGANGIGLSPGGDTLFATEYGAGRLWKWSVDGPGRLRMNPAADHGGTLVWQDLEARLLDSIGITRNGFVVMATQPAGGFTVVSPEGNLLAIIPMPDAFPTNICFDSSHRDVAYATLSRTGRLVRIAWDEDLLVERASATENLKETKHA